MTTPDGDTRLILTAITVDWLCAACLVAATGIPRARLERSSRSSAKGSESTGHPIV